MLLDFSKYHIRKSFTAGSKMQAVFKTMLNSYLSAKALTLHHISCGATEFNKVLHILSTFRQMSGKFFDAVPPVKQVFDKAVSKKCHLVYMLKIYVVKFERLYFYHIFRCWVCGVFNFTKVQTFPVYFKMIVTNLGRPFSQ